MLNQPSMGFIGLGVMGEPMCRNLAQKTAGAVLAFDLDPAPLERLSAHGVRSAGLAEMMATCDAIFMSLPSGEVVQQVCHAPDGLLQQARAGQCIVDLSTSRVDTTRQLALEFSELGVDFADAPVARTRAAAESGTLAVMVGATPAVFDRIKPLLETFATDISLCGPVGCGQVVKILNNMVLFETVLALSEAKVIGERAGVDPSVLFRTLASGSADSFALRSHGMKSMLPGEFPEKAFSVRYALKDLSYALQLAQETGVDARAAQVVESWMKAAIDDGLGDLYHPVVSRMVGADHKP
jgi:3-hydroxyisobutyrate dehydrogenase-like beta-hydroxyacid dehydrogenase